MQSSKEDPQSPTVEKAPPKAEQAAASAPKQPKLSTPQMLHLMRLEVEKALTHGYPISCMLYGLDGFDQDETFLLRKQVMPRVFHELKTVCFNNKVQGLGIWTEAFQLAVFPHVTPDQLQTLAQGMLDGAHAIKLPEIPASVEIQLSIGISHNLHQGDRSFEKLVEDAESGMSLAQSSGGNRISEWRKVETEVDQLKAELEASLREIEEVQEKLFGSEQAAEEELWGKNLIKSVVTLFRKEETSEAAIRLERDVIALLKDELTNLRNTSSVSQLLESQKQIENMERRISKLTQSLGATEEELRRVAAMKDIDLGVSSIYRTVQGLTSSDDNFAAKKEMLKNIFEANVALRDAMTKKT